MFGTGRGCVIVCEIEGVGVEATFKVYILNIPLSIDYIIVLWCAFIKKKVCLNYGHSVFITNSVWYTLY